MKWTGSWVDPPYPYLGVLVERVGKKYYGWIAVSFDDVVGTVKIFGFYVNDRQILLLSEEGKTIVVDPGPELSMVLVQPGSF